MRSLQSIGLALCALAGLWVAAGCSNFDCYPNCRTPAGQLNPTSSPVHVLAKDVDDANSKCMGQADAKAACKYGAVIAGCSCSPASASTSSLEEEAPAQPPQ